MSPESGLAQRGDPRAHQSRRSHYPLCRSARSRGHKLVGIDSTQGYLKSPEAAPRAFATFGAFAPAVTLLAVLREPTSRLLSNYYHRRKSGEILVGETFDAYAGRQLDESARCGGGRLWGRCGTRPTDGLWVGLYAQQIEHWLGAGFDAAANFALVPFRRVTGDQTRALNAIFRVLDLPCAATQAVTEKVNQKTPENASMMGPIRARLSAFYRPQNDALVRLIHAEHLVVQLASADYASPAFADYACDAADPEHCAWPF